MPHSDVGRNKSAQFRQSALPGTPCWNSTPLVPAYNFRTASLRNQRDQSYDHHRFENAGFGAVRQVVVAIGDAAARAIVA